MEIETGLLCAINMTPLAENLRVAFSMASVPGQENLSAEQRCEVHAAPQFCAVSHDLITEAEVATGFKAKHLNIFPARKLVIVEGSPLLIQSMIDHGHGIIEEAALVLKPEL